MTGDCGNCQQHGTNDQRITSLEKRVSNLENDHSEHRDKLSGLDRDSAVMENRFNNIIVTLAKIEGTLDTMQKAIDELKLKPAESWKWVVGICGGGALMAVVNYFMAMILRG